MPDPLLTPPPRRPLGEIIAERLRDAIVQGHFRPGEWLREEGLATRLEVSRGTIRDALVLLEREGLVLIHRNRGATVAELTREDLEEIYSLRLFLERLSVRCAAVRGRDEDFDAVQAALDRYAERLLEPITGEQSAEFDIEIHDAIFAATHHRRLQNDWRGLRSEIYLVLFNHMVVDDEWRGNAVAGHAEILAALRARDGARASELMVAHLQVSYDRVLRSLQEKEDRGATEEVPVELFGLLT